MYIFYVIETCTCIMSCRFNSPKPKVQVSFSEHLLSVVRPSVGQSANIFYFSLNTIRPDLTNLLTKHPCGKGIINCKILMSKPSFKGR